MASNVSARVIDNGLAVLDTEPDRLFICSAEPTTYALASTNGAVRLGQKTFAAGAFFGAPQAGTGAGRKVSSIAFADGVVTTTGTATHWAVCDSVNSRLLATGTLAAPTAVTNTAAFGLPSFSIQVSISIGAAQVGVGLVASVLTTAAPVFGSAVLNASAILTGWNTLKVGGGGLITGMDTAPDGTVLCRSDSYGAYVYDRAAANPGNAGGVGAWRQLVTTTSMVGALSTVTAPFSNDGVFEIRVAPSDSNVLYMAYHFRMYKSTNKGVTWTHLTSFANRSDILGNTGQARVYQYKMAIDPVNPNVVIFIALNGTVFRTENGGTTWPTLSGIAAAANANVCCVAYGIDVSGGRTQTVYISVDGAGLYRSTNRGDSFSLVDATHTSIYDLKVAADGKVYYCDYFGEMYKYDGTSVTAITPGGVGAYDVNSLICHPSDATKLVALGYNSGFRESANSGSTWTAANATHATFIATDCPWLGDLQDTYGFFTAGVIAPIWDRLDTTKLWCSVNQGICQTSMPFPTAPTPLTFTYVAAGMETLVGDQTLLPPGSNLLLTISHDAGIIPKDMANSQKYALDQAWDIHNFLNHAGSADYAKDNPAFIAAMVGWQFTGDESAYSTSSGAAGSWVKFAGQPAFAVNHRIGCIACKTTQNIVRVGGTNDGGLWRTTDGGANWSKVIIANLSDGGSGDNHTTAAYSSGATVIGVTDVNGIKANGWIYIDGSGQHKVTGVAGLNVTIAAPGLLTNRATNTYVYNVTGWGSSFYFTRQNLTVSDSGIYYASNYAPELAGIYKSTDGSSWSKTAAVFTADVGIAANLKAVPGVRSPDHLFFTKGAVGSGGDPASNWPSGQIFYYSTNGGDSWADASNLTNTGSGNQFTIRDVWCFGFGKEAPGQSYPAIYIYGWVNAGASPSAAGSAPGFYRSINGGVTWTQFGTQYPIGWCEFYRNISASLDTYGLVFAASQGSGFIYYKEP